MMLGIFQERDDKEGGDIKVGLMKASGERYKCERFGW